MSCDELSILQITDGTTIVDLLDKNSGFLLKDWTPQIATYKDGGIFQESPLSTGRRLVAYRFANVTETMTVSSRHVTPDALIRDTQELRRLLQKAADYWATDWQNTPVYIQARGKGETNIRYCLIQQGRLGIDGNPYAQPFMQGSGSLYASVFDDQPLIIERGHWLSEEPGTTTSVALSGTQDWATPGDWAELTTTPTGSVVSMLETSAGVLLAGTSSFARLYASSDGGGTWAQAGQYGTVSSAAINDIIEASNGYLLMGVSGLSADYGIYRSTDGGDNWTRVYDGTGLMHNVYALAEFEYSGWIWAVGENTSLSQAARGYSIDNGNIWETFSAFSGASKVLQEMSDTTSMALYNVDDVLYSVTGTRLNNLTSEINHGSGEFRSLIKLSSGKYIAGVDDGTVYYSPDGATWTASSDTLTGGCFAFSESSDGYVFAGSDGTVWISYDEGVSWYQHSSLPTADSESVMTKSDGTVYAGDSGRIIELAKDNTATVETVVNSFPLANITIIKIYDDSSATYTDVFPDSTLPYNLLPDPPDTSGDTIYFGMESGAGGLPFSSLVFNLADEVTNLYLADWEYWDGSAWSDLDLQDNTNQGSGPFFQTGQWAVVWDIPSDWATTTIDSVSALWVRVVTGANNNSTDPPVQTGYDVFAMRSSYVEISNDAIGGDIPALAQMEINVASDVDGPSGSAPNMYVNRVVVGLRSVSRGNQFKSHLNASDQGNIFGVTVDVGTDTTFADDITYPTARRAVYSPASTGSWLDVVTWSISGDLVRDYNGTFHVFLRARQTGGSAGDIILRMVTSTGSGGIEITTQSQAFENTNPYQFMDFGRVSFPVSSLQNDDESGDEAKIVIQANASSTTPDIYFTDVVLIPIDEWYGDFTDQQRDATSPVTNRYYLDVDSATFPKRSVRALVRNLDSAGNKIKNVFQPSTNGEFTLQANAQQRIWFFFARTAGAGSPNIWYSEPFAAAKITLRANQRYLGMRGAR